MYLCSARSFKQFNFISFRFQRWYIIHDRHTEFTGEWLPALTRPGYSRYVGETLGFYSHSSVMPGTKSKPWHQYRRRKGIYIHILIYIICKMRVRLQKTTNGIQFVFAVLFLEVICLCCYTGVHKDPNTRPTTWCWGNNNKITILDVW